MSSPPTRAPTPVSQGASRRYSNVKPVVDCRRPSVAARRPSVARPVPVLGRPVAPSGMTPRTVRNATNARRPSRPAVSTRPGAPPACSTANARRQSRAPVSARRTPRARVASRTSPRARRVSVAVRQTPRAKPVEAKKLADVRRRPSAAPKPLTREGKKDLYAQLFDPSLYTRWGVIKRLRTFRYHSFYVGITKHYATVFEYTTKKFVGIYDLTGCTITAIHKREFSVHGGTLGEVLMFRTETDHEAQVWHSAITKAIHHQATPAANLRGSALGEALLRAM